MKLINYDKAFLSSLSRSDLRRALWFLRWSKIHPYAVNPAANQYINLATLGSIYAEYKRRKWKIPKQTRHEKR